jgi:lipoate-protein ligase A
VKFLDLTFPTPAENLACDEALLDLCEEEGRETLRLWESSDTFVVVGYGNSVAREVLVEACQQRGIPILRRCSGGGTVVQGSGCLNYNLTLRIDTRPALQSVTGANTFVMERHRAAMENLLGKTVSVQGHTDLAFLTDATWWKFSGNAQRRRRRSLVFHGTILHRFDLTIIDALLGFPSAQPDYRAGRRHSDFVRNIPVSAAQIRQALHAAWDAKSPAGPIPANRMATLLRDHYLNDDWNLRR